MATLATDPPVSEKQRKAMWAARGGHSTLGIPASVGRKFVGPGHDMEPRDWEGILKYFEEEAGEPEHSGRGWEQAQVTLHPWEPGRQRVEHGADSLPHAAGVLLMNEQGEVLLLKRSSAGDHPGEWCLPGGGLEAGEDAESCARRELEEETGYSHGGELSTIDRQKTGGVDFATFFAHVNKFTPKLNKEHSDAGWRAIDNLPEAIHPGVAKTLKLVHKGIKESLAHDALPFAYDRSSVREEDADGRLHVLKTPISKANICPYIGKEIPGYKELGLDPDKIYKLYRDPQELAKAVNTFNGIQLLIKHKPVSAKGKDDHQPDLIVGATGTDASFEDPYLFNSLVVWARKGIDLIESGDQKELSSAYRYRADMTPGAYAGEKFDGTMRDIVGNHVALVEEGRAGSDVVVGDSKESLMSKPTALQNFVQGLIYANVQPILAMDVNLDFAKMGVEGLTAKNWDERKPRILKTLAAQLKGKLAQDASLDDIHHLMDSLDGPAMGGGGDNEGAAGEKPFPIKAGKTEEQDEEEALDDEPFKKYLTAKLEGKCSPEEINEIHDLAKEHLGSPGLDEAEGEEHLEKLGAADEPEEFEGKPKRPGLDKKGKDGKMVFGKPAKDKKAKDAEPVTKGAMDAAVAKALLDNDAKHKAIREAEQFVRPWTGQLNIALDSAEAIYRHALKTAHPGKDYSKLDLAGLKAVLDVTPKPGAKPRLATDSARTPNVEAQKSFGSRFPGAAKIRVG